MLRYPSPLQFLEAHLTPPHHQLTIHLLTHISSPSAPRPLASRYCSQSSWGFIYGGVVRDGEAKLPHSVISSLTIPMQIFQVLLLCGRIQNCRNMILRERIRGQSTLMLQELSSRLLLHRQCIVRGGKSDLLMSWLRRRRRSILGRLFGEAVG
jgi:hypothetical protein